MLGTENYPSHSTATQGEANRIGPLQVAAQSAIAYLKGVGFDECIGDCSLIEIIPRESYWIEDPGAASH